MMTGLIGYGSFSGDARDLMPFLVAGLYVHAGKGASFGMGRYELLPIG
jgi:CRISPR/Cas system endoribonuclease Cas6 (RAMP superfamily)